MTEEEVIRFVGGMSGVEYLTAGEGSGAPEVAWGDTFFYYDPDGTDPADRKFPFATIVIKDYDGFDTLSNVNRPGVFRVNIAVGRHVYQDLFGHSPAAHAEHHDEYDYTALDRLIPHPVYAVQGWVSVLNPGESTADRTRELLTQAHTRATTRRHHRI